VVVRGRYYLLDERAWYPTIALRAHLKVPTADAERGLGTGRPDEGIGVEVTRTLGRGLAVMADGGYTFLAGLTAWSSTVPGWYDVGLGQDLARGMVNVSVFLEEYQAIVPGPPQRARRAGGVHTQGARLAGADRHTAWCERRRRRARIHVGISRRF
jgi:hypothetical protein